MLAVNVTNLFGQAQERIYNLLVIAVVMKVVVLLDGAPLSQMEGKLPSTAPATASGIHQFLELATPTNIAVPLNSFTKEKTPKFLTDKIGPISIIDNAIPDKKARKIFLPLSRLEHESLSASPGTSKLKSRYTSTKRAVNVDAGNLDNDKCDLTAYSCQGRCQAPPRVACSCHWTCHVYENCCEDVDEFCPVRNPEFSAIISEMAPLTVRCIGHNYLLASCPASFGGSQWEELKEFYRNTNENYTSWLHFTGTDISYSDIINSCEDDSGTSLLHLAPVTDTRTSLQFKNILCAVCNNVITAQPWNGLISCSTTNRSIGTLHEQVEILPNLSKESTLEYHTVGEIMNDPSCQVAWVPAAGSPNTCIPPENLANFTLQSSETDDGNTTTTTATPSSPPNYNSTSEDDTHFDKGDTDSFAIGSPEWEEMKEYPGRLAKTFNSSNLQDKCETLASPVEYSGHIYKNLHCFYLATNSTSARQVCEPRLPRLPNTEVRWYTLGITHSSGWPSWQVKPGLNHQYMSQALDIPEEEPCDHETQLIIEGVCAPKSFRMLLTITFTFDPVSLLKGDYKRQVDSYTALTKAVGEDNISNATTCVSVTQQFHCEGLAGESNFTKVTTNKMESKEEIIVSRMIHFVNSVVDTLLDRRGVTLPVTITLKPCIIIDLEKNDQLKVFCSERENVWKATRKRETIFGNVSLEGLITIICCSLSNFGLLVRLTLQHVVPFFNSYPGKVQFSLCLSLFMAYTLFLIGGIVQEGSESCRVVAVLTHLAFLSALFWMNVTAFEIWRIFRHWRNQVTSRGNASLAISSVYALGVPVMIVAAALLLEEFAPWSDFSPSYGRLFCWLNGAKSVALFFVAPCSFICCTNAIFVGLTLRGLRQHRTGISELNKSNTMTTATDTTIVVKIILLVGITWLLGLLAALVENQVLWIIFTIVNASLGFFISIVLVVNRRVFYALQNKCLCINTNTTSVISTNVPKN